MPSEITFTLIYYLFTCLLLTANNILQLNYFCHINHLAMLFKMDIELLQFRSFSMLFLEI